MLNAMLIGLALTAINITPESPGFDLALNHTLKVEEVPWTQRPTGEDIANLYPNAALLSHISGQVTVNCQILPTGVLDSCKVVRETPPGKGFGEATIKVVHFFRALPGPYGPASKVEFPMRWQPS